MTKTEAIAAMKAGMATRQDFYDHFKVTEQDISAIWELFMEYGMSRGEAPHRSKANHYILIEVKFLYFSGWYIYSTMQ